MENNNPFIMTEKVISNVNNWSHFGFKENEFPKDIKNIKVINCSFISTVAESFPEHNLFVSNSTFYTLDHNGDNTGIEITIKAFEKNKDKKNMYIELDPESKSKDVMGWIFFTDNFSDNKSIEQITIKNAEISCLDLCEYPNLKKLNLVNCNIKSLAGPEKENKVKFNLDGCKIHKRVLKKYAALSEKEKTVLPKQVEMSI